MKRIYPIILFILITVTGYAQGHFVLAYTGYGQDHMNIDVVTAAIGDVNLKAGDEIGVFDGEICCGKVILTAPIIVGNPATHVIISASRADLSESNGYTAGNPILYRFWDAANQIEIASGINADYFQTNGQPAPAPVFTAGASVIVKLTVATQANQNPTANAGPDQSVNEGDQVSLDGTASNDPDNDPVTYLWTAPSGITLSDANSASPVFIAPEVSADTDYTFSLVVNDGQLSSTSDQVIIRVKQVNKIPVAVAGADQSANEGDQVTLDGTASADPDHDLLSYSWQSPDGITLSSVSSANPAFTAPEVQSDQEFIFSLIVNDGQSNSLADEIKVTVKQVNQIPTAKAGTDQTLNEGTLVSLNGSASTDPDGDALLYSWTVPQGIVLNSKTIAQPSFTAPEVQTDKDFLLSLIVSDGISYSLADEVIITVKQVNKAPVAYAGPDQSVNEKSVYTLDGSVSSDADGDALTYKWTAPNGITLSSSSTVKPTFTAPDVTVNTKFTFTLVVNDGKVDSPGDHVTITVKQDNMLPQANAGIDQVVNEGSLVTLDGSGSSDPDSDVLTYIWTAPSGIILGSTNSVKSTFTAPEVSSDTEFILSLAVNDGTAVSAADQVKITVKQVNKAPKLTSSKSFNVVADLPFEILLEGSDLDGEPINYFIENLPANLLLTKISDSSAKLSGTFTNVSAGNNSFKLTLSDGLLNIQENLSINVAYVDHAPFIKDPIQDISVDKSAPEKVIDLKTVFADDDSRDVLTYGLTSNSNNQVVQANITGSVLTLTFSTQYTGFSDIVLTAGSNGKTVQSKFNVEVRIPTGIELPVNEPGVLVYPNPTKGNVTIQFNDVPEEDTRITVYNITGKIITQIRATQKHENLNLEGNVPGLYFIKAGAKTFHTFKVVLE